MSDVSSSSSDVACSMPDTSASAAAVTASFDVAINRCTTPANSAEMPNTCSASSSASLHACGVSADTFCAIGVESSPLLDGWQGWQSRPGTVVADVLADFAPAVPHAPSSPTSPIVISSLNFISYPSVAVGSGQLRDDCRRLVRLPCRVPCGCGRVLMAHQLLRQ